MGSTTIEPMSAPDRRIVLEGAKNFRDLGGYPAAGGRTVRRGRLFRSDRLTALTESDARTLESLGLSTVLDLRSEEEIERQGGCDALTGIGVRHWHVPFTRDPVHTLREAHTDGRPALDYLEMAEGARGAIGTLFTAFAEDAHYSAVFHCAVGKDRTGIVAALLLASLGVDEQTIVEDYALTSQYFEWTEADMTSLHERFTPEFAAQLIAAEPPTMQALLDGLRERYGSPAGFLADAGVGASELARVREHLLEG